MQMTTYLKIKHSLERLPRIASAVLLVGAVTAVGCGETDDGLDPPFQGPVAAAPGGPGGGTTGGAVQPTPGGGTTGGGTTGGVVVPPATAGGGTTGAGGGTTGGGAVGAESDWCKIKKITDVKCVACHTTPLAAGAPFPLAKYEDFTAAHPTKPGKKIYERVGVRVHADKSKLEMLGSMPPGVELPADQLALIDAWVAAKAPAGADPTCAGSAPVKPVDDGVWPLPECDAVYKITSHATSGSGPYMVPPGQEIHPQISIPAPWGSEKVQAIAFKAITDNPAVLHHWILNGGGAFLNGWAPGEDGVKKMAADTGMDMPSGNLRLDMHYNSLQQKASMPDASGLEICAVKSAHFRKNHVAVSMGLSSFLISIPANAKNYEVKASCTVSAPITLLTASPHSHTLAVRHRFTVAKKSGGAEIVMHDKPFQFGEQKTYPLDAPLPLVAGDVIKTSCFYTNPSAKTVTFGENTGNEMCFNFASYYPAGALSCGAGLDIGSIFGGP